MGLLQFENELLLKLVEEDGLVITAKGLGIERVLLNLIKVYNHPGNLILVIGTSFREEEYFLEQLKIEDVQPAPKLITSECGVNDRYQVYMQGGTMFVTSRILVVDMLTWRVPIDLITGIIVYKAHKILESCQEAFILRLYRQKNKKGFIKALSSNPCAFTRRFCQVERVMRNLFARQLYLWPRSHEVVNSSLEKIQPEVTEIHINMTASMQAIQTSLLDLMNVCVKEIKKINSRLDTEELTLENAISRSFDKIVKFQLDPIWHQLGPKTRRLVADLKTLRIILESVTQCDSVTFYSLLKSIKDSVTNNFQISDWLFLDSAENMFIQARERVFGPESKSKVAKTTNGEQAQSIKPEVSPKWLALVKTLTEIQQDITINNKFAPVLIVVNDEKTRTQIKDLLCSGADVLLNRLYNRLLRPDLKDSTTENYKISKPPKEDGKKKKKPKVKNERTLTQMAASDHDCVHPEVCVENVNLSDDSSERDELVASIESSKNTSEEPIIVQPTIIYPLHGEKDPFGLQWILTEFYPKYIVMYDADVGVVRQLEIYQAFRPHLSVQVYLLMYQGSAEEQRYLTALRKEKEAFEYLMKKRESVVVPENWLGITAANQTVNAGKAEGEIKVPCQQKIIVDLREFRSDLPSLIHRRGIDVEPITLEVGDYILTPDTCVERKSLNDLIGSLNNGRLYSQAQAMSRYYKQPILLIEFDQTKAFSLQGKYYLSTEVSATSVASKLILLTIHFPHLRILWCPSPYASAEMFELLKDFLCHLPGISTKNIRKVMMKVTSLANLMTKTQDELTQILENSNSVIKLWEALHQSMKATDKAPVKRTFSKNMAKKSK
ncbi:DNA repair endonuclease XPF-like [Limulus polyphemus]|uniref:DNA repair endonuclease XPF-like n=1 Tax=Limulus polyphemus TaxID=6850 RepID=A0ABM1B7W9_LIMPO|nr:DNA repair endonuclease XPF-like [Limulus polyphemus]